MIIREIPLSFTHRVLFTRRVFSPENDTLVKVLEQEGRPAEVLVFLDAGVSAANPTLLEEIDAYFAEFTNQVRLMAKPILLPGGEAAKNDWHEVETIWKSIHDHGLCRHSYVVAIGGGAILDLVGFAAATAHRGIRHVRMPTTTLSQGDGGVGVKNGVNRFGKKNWIGTFTVPHAIINDVAFLEALPDREKRAGLIEAVKVALIRDRAFFERIEILADSLAAFSLDALEEVIAASARHHVEHIASGGDPFELGSARPLDFGHWVAHKLEQLSAFNVGHGEAVAIGMAVDLVYSVDIGLLDAVVAERILALIQRLGFVLNSPYLDRRDEATGERLILRGLEEFREHLGGELTITLVPEIGRKLEVHTMDEAAVARALERFLG